MHWSTQHCSELLILNREEWGGGGGGAFWKTCMKILEFYCGIWHIVAWDKATGPGKLWKYVKLKVKM